jgi:hypothetical protein
MPGTGFDWFAWQTSSRGNQGGSEDGTISSGWSGDTCLILGSRFSAESQGRSVSKRYSIP